jgi:hypothetical protein
MMEITKELAAKRIKEQFEYIHTVVKNKTYTPERKKEILESAIGVAEVFIEMYPELMPLMLCGFLGINVQYRPAPKFTKGHSEVACIGETGKELIDFKPVEYKPRYLKSKITFNMPRVDLYKENIKSVAVELDKTTIHKLQLDAYTYHSLSSGKEELKKILDTGKSALIIPI